jgi:hypothetical protein
MGIHSKHTAKIEALLKRGKGFYLVVRCHTHPEHIIKLQRVLSAQDLEKYKVSPFYADCELCGKTQQYYARQVEGWMGSPPDKTFQTHPSFR